MLDRNYIPLRETQATQKLSYWSSARKLYVISVSDFEVLKLQRSGGNKRKSSELDDIRTVLESVKRQLHSTSGTHAGSSTSDNILGISCMICLDKPDFPLYFCPGTCNRIIGCMKCVLPLESCPQCREPIPENPPHVRGIDHLADEGGYDVSSEETLSAALAQRFQTESHPHVVEIDDDSSDDFVETRNQ
ncbi:uncharacterized protein [Ptychodera flava]